MFFKKKSFMLILLFLFLFTPIHARSIKHKRHHYLSTYITAIAKSMLGKRYKWGGNGPYSYDCSGFTKKVFQKFGIRIPRNSWNQAKVGKKIVKRSRLKRGDLVFFTSKHHTRVNHVGIYIGHGKFIHASRFHHRIVISPLREYKKYFKWGRRLT